MVEMAELAAWCAEHLGPVPTGNPDAPRRRMPDRNRSTDTRGGPMRTTIRIVVTLVAATIALVVWQAAASAATVIEYGLIA